MKKVLTTLLVLVTLLVACSGGKPAVTPATSGLPADAAAIAAARGLTQDDIAAALKTYTPSGQLDPYIMFASGGQSGQVLVIGVPSMRILKLIAVFTPEPWQGYGFGGSSDKVIEGGYIPNGDELKWGDTHHPNLSETNGEYDGQFLFINDKANPRLAVIDLRDFETKQIVVSPIYKTEHGGAFVTPNSEYVMEAAQYASPLENVYVPLDQFNEKYRGGVTYWKFDRKAVDSWVASGKI
ncbi:MAG: cytochrome C, partial [Chloroflexota bacterium]